MVSENARCMARVVGTVVETAGVTFGYASGIAELWKWAAADVARLRARLRDNDNVPLDKYAGCTEAVEKGRPFLFGSALTGLGRLDTGTVGTVVAAIGIVLAAVFGAPVGLTDHRKLEISRDGRDAMSITDEAALHADALNDEVRHRRHRD